MGNALEKAQKAARKAIESTYAGVATVSEYKKVKDPNTALTSYKEVVVLENQPYSFWHCLHSCLRSVSNLT